jgi:hypothetical protein
MTTVPDACRTFADRPADADTGTPERSPVAPGIIGACLAQHRQLQFEVAHYIECLVFELGVMARAAELRHLLYFLEMTRQEAANQTRRFRPID